MAYRKHIVLYHWSLCACIVIGCVIRVYIGSCVATRGGILDIILCENLRYISFACPGKFDKVS